MSKFDVAKYWQFRVWVKSQIEQLRELVSEYQPSSGGGGDSDFDPDGAYPNMSVGKATTATTLASAPAISASGNGIAITAGGKTSSTLSLKTINGTSIIGSGDIDTRGDFDPDGTYPNMSVGTASDLAGRIEASPAVFTYRPSAGDKSIRGNTASITSIKGNSVVWNQNAMPLTADSQYISNASRIRFTFANNRAVGTYVGPGMAYIATNSRLNRSISGHKYYRSMLLSVPKSGVVRIGQYSNQTVVATINKYNTIVRYDIVYESDGNVALWGFTPDSTWVAGDTCTIYDILDIDLTAMYGAGSEPTAEEFRAVFTDSYYPTTEMTLLRNLNLSGIETVGFNQWDGNAIQGYINDTNGNYVNNTNYKCTGYIDVIDSQEYFATITGSAEWGAWYDADKVFISGFLGYGVLTPPLGAKYMRLTIYNQNKPYDYTKFCVNLRHTGYRDGETEPYTKVLHNLPISEITNGEPLRSCGNVYDEITNFDYIKRVGVRAYELGDENNSLYLTDGIHTNYPLEQEIITPISTIIDFRYYVEDFGTEKAVFSANSAPLRADIIYSFNATDSIRQNRISIQKLNDIFSGSKGEYVRADGSWGYIADLKGNFFVKPTLKRIRTGISELSDTIQIIHPYLTEHIGDAKIVLMAVKRRGGSYYDRATNAKGRRKKRKAWGELHYAAMPNTEINHNTIEMPNGASFEAWQNVILHACGRIPEGLENAREPYNVNVALEDLAEFFATNGAIFVGKTPVIRLGVALRIPNPNFIDYGNGNKMWDYNDVTGKWEYKYLYSDVAEVVVKSQMLRTGGYVLGLELV